MAVSHIFSSPVANRTGTLTIWDGVTTASVVATNLVCPGDWNSVHNQFFTLSGNTTSGSTASGSNVIYSGAGGISVGATSDTVIFSGPRNTLISSIANAPVLINQTAGGFAMTLDGASVSHACAINIPENLSASFIRIPVSMTTNSTTLATSAVSISASVDIYSTWNAVFYSLGIGASSKSLQSVASGSNGWTFRNSISCNANGTQYSITQGFTANAQGGGTTRTTQYSISNTNLSFTTNQIATEFSGLRFLDINFDNSLSAGPYWLVFGYSSVTSGAGGNSSRITAATACNVKYSNHYGMSQPNSAWGIMGSTDFTSGGLMAAGVFSTAGGGTTASIPISAISSTLSNQMPYFQMLRSA